MALQCPQVLSCVRIPKLEDRKSTRLNSSHTVISYAVFCLTTTLLTHPLPTRRPTSPRSLHQSNRLHSTWITVRKRNRSLGALTFASDATTARRPVSISTTG